MTTCSKLGQCPAASAYGDYLREKRNGMCPIQREHERVKTLLDACRPMPRPPLIVAEDRRAP